MTTNSTARITRRFTQGAGLIGAVALFVLWRDHSKAASQQPEIAKNGGISDAEAHALYGAHSHIFQYDAFLPITRIGEEGSFHSPLHVHEAAALAS